MSVKHSKSTINSLQMLRAIASALVVLAHAQNHLHARGIISEQNPLIRFGSSGVDIFFVISGFIMVYVAGDKFSTYGYPAKFFIRRVIRVVPVYWFYTIAIAALLYLVPSQFSEGKSFDWGHLFASLFFVPWSNNHEAINPVLGVGWTLNFEMYFYLVFTFLLFFNRHIFVPLLSIVLVSGVMIGLLSDSIPGYLRVMTSPLLVEFLLGALIGVLYIRESELLLKYSKHILFLGIILFAITASPLFQPVQNALPGQLHRLIEWGVPAAFIVAGFVFLERAGKMPVNNYLVTLGDSSYSLYLCHIFVIALLAVFWIRFIGDYYYLYILTAFFLCLFAGHMSYLLVEKPTVTYLNNLYKRIVN